MTSILSRPFHIQTLPPPPTRGPEVPERKTQVVRQERYPKKYLFCASLLALAILSPLFAQKTQKVSPVLQATL